MDKLKRQTDFDCVFQKGKRVYSSSLMMIYLPKQGQSLIGISVSKKHGNAVKRNRVKRLLRAVYLQKRVSIRAGYFIVFLPKPADEYSYEKFKAEINRLLKKEDLLC